MQIARAVCDYLTNEEIANRLGISERTVKGQLEIIRLKLGVERKRDIPKRLREIGLVK